MRIHTNIIDPADMYRAAEDAGDGVTVEFMEHGSRSRLRAFEFSLSGTSNRRRNSGNRGAGDEYAATWDEWGMFLAHLFALDPEARSGWYESADYFHWVTGGRFRDLTPAMQHGGSGHRWGMAEPVVNGRYYVRECKCGATMRHLASGIKFEDLS